MKNMKKFNNIIESIFSISCGFYEGGWIFVGVIGLICLAIYEFGQISDLPNNLTTIFGIVFLSCIGIILLPLFIILLTLICSIFYDLFSIEVFLEDERVYTEYLYFPHGIINGKIKYNYNCFTDYTYRNIEEKIVPALQKLYKNATYNKSTKIMYKSFEPQIKELYTTMKKFIKSVKEEKDEIILKTTMNNFNESVNDILEYINDLNAQLEEIVIEDLENEQIKEEATITLSKSKKVENFGTIKMMNKLSHSDIDELFEKYENIEEQSLTKQIKELNKKLENHPKAKKKKKIRKQIKELEERLEM